MNKKLLAKIVLIIGLTLFAFIALWPPQKTLKPGIDLAGGTSLIYEIDATGTSLDERKNLSTNMINVLRRRVDPANIQNLVWRPQGDTRFEIQMPLAGAEAREKRQKYEDAMNNLLTDNIPASIILPALKKGADQRDAFFKQIAADSNSTLQILTNLATAYDRYNSLRSQSDSLNAVLETLNNKISSEGIDSKQLKTNLSKWIHLTEPNLTKQISSFLHTDPNSPNTDKTKLVKEYIETYSQWSNITNQLTNPESSVTAAYQDAKKEIDKLNLTEERVISVLEMSSKQQRNAAINELKKQFPQRSEKIDAVVKAYDLYKPFEGRLDDPKDFQRMLKGSGILEFRILPTEGYPGIDNEKMKAYIQNLRDKGSKAASDKEYVWCEVEKSSEIFVTTKAGKVVRWGDGQGRHAIVADFGNKTYVLASNRADECMLHSTEKPWRLKKSTPGRESQTGRRAIDFVLDERGGDTFANITAKNLKRPLCILLDDIAISAPNINARIYTQGQITGDFTQNEQIDFVNKLNAGSLPARLIEPPISVKIIGPSIGAENRDKSIKSGFIGMIMVIAFMAVYYTFGGCIADTALLVNLLFTLAIMALLKATFTLPGIAGAILTIGMSVDANVLIFERIREEQHRGSTIRNAIKTGYKKAFTAIFDSHVTAITSSAVLYWVGSEEIKGFAIVLILGLLANLFTAVFATRIFFELLLAKGIIKDHLIMLHLIRKPNINWMALRPVFFTLSAILTIGGLVLFFTRDNTKSNKYDIEFTGGTSAVLDFKQGTDFTRQEVEDMMKKVGADMKNPAIASASVYSVGKPIGEKGSEKIFQEYEINTTETNKILANITFKDNKTHTIDEVKAAIGGQLKGLVVTTSGKNASFEIASTETNKSNVGNILKSAFPDADISEPQVEETVNNAIFKAFGDHLEILQNLQPQITSSEKITSSLIESQPQLADFLGGIKITCTLQKAAGIEEIQKRLQDLVFKPETQNLPVYSHKIFSPALSELKSGQLVNTFVYVSKNEEFVLRQPSTDEWRSFEENETTKVTAALKIAQTLPQVTQISPSVGSESKTRAILAIILSLMAMLVYIWFRFGDFRFGFGAVITLFHDTCVTLGAVSICYYLSKTSIGQNLLIGDFKINLAMIAAFLTLIGYSLSDTIVIYDRIRENRPKSGLTPQIISNSINETMSRTIITSMTVFIVVLIMYIFGGEVLRGFNFAMTFGVIIGTYSSIAISAPILLFKIKSKNPQQKK